MTFRLGSSPTSNRVGPLIRSFPSGIFLVALLLRLIPVLLSRSLGIGLDDMFQYDMLARSLAAGNGFRWYAAQDLQQLEPYVHFDTSLPGYDPVRGVETSFRAPLYPAFLALIYFLFGSGADRFFAARLAQAVFLGAPLAPLTYFIARRFFSPVDETRERVARLAAWTVALYPILLVYPLALATENLFFLLLLLSFLFLLRSSECPTAINFLLSGVFLGLTALTRSIILPFAGLAILWAWFLLKQKRGAVWIALCLLLTVAPWVVRNSLLYHKLTGIESSMGYNLYLGYHPQGNGSFVFGPSLDLLPILNDAERDQIGTQKALEFIRTQPERFLPLALNRLEFFFGLEKRALLYFYSNDVIGYLPFPLLLIVFLLFVAPFIFVSLSASLGTALLRWDSVSILFLLLFFAYLLPHVLILSEDRFHLALVPFFAILSAHFQVGGFHGLLSRWNASRAGKLVAILAVVLALLLCANWGLELFRDADKLSQFFGPNGNLAGFSY